MSVFISNENIQNVIVDENTPNKLNITSKESRKSFFIEELNTNDEVNKEVTKEKNSTFKKMIKTPVKAIRNLLPSVPSGWYGSASKSSKNNDEESDSLSSSSSTSISVSDRIQALNNSQNGLNKSQNKDNNNDDTHNSNNDSTNYVIKDKKIETNTKANTEILKKEKQSSNRRISMGLSMRSFYDEEMHMPKYSQAELDAAIEKAINDVKLSTKDIESKSNKNDKEIEDLKDQIKVLQEKESKAITSHSITSKELNELKTTMASIGEDAGLHKVQSKALTHRLQTLEQDYSKLQEEKDKLSLEAQTDAIKKIAEERERTEKLVEAAQKEGEAALQACAEEAEKRVGTLQSELEEKNRQLKKMESREAKKVAAAVSEAKARVYEKAKQQFEAGNAEFKSVRQQLKTALAEQETQSVELKKIQSDYQESKTSCDTLTTKIASTENHLKALLQLLLPESSQSEHIDTDAAVASAKANIAVNTSRLKALEAEAKSLRERVPLLEERASVAENATAELEMKAALSSETIKATEALLAESKAEIAAAVAERDAQMTAVAKLATSNATLDAEVESVKKEAVENAERCAGLRKMNEELLAMLEASETK